MSIYSAIKEEHDRHRKLLRAIAETEGDSADRRRMFAALKEDLTSHANAEEQTFYADLIGSETSQEQARHSVSEHKEADDLLKELAETEMSSSGWLTRFKALKEEVEHHMDEEEDDVFALARKVISGERADVLGRQFRSRKADELKQAS